MLRREGIDIRTGVGVASAARDTSGRVTIMLADGAQIMADEILVAAGRTLNVRGIGVDTVGLDESKRPTISTDEHMARQRYRTPLGDRRHRRTR